MTPPKMKPVAKESLLLLSDLPYTCEEHQSTAFQSEPCRGYDPHLTTTDGNLDRGTTGLWLTIEALLLTVLTPAISRGRITTNSHLGDIADAPFVARICICICISPRSEGENRESLTSAMQILNCTADRLGRSLL